MIVTRHFFIEKETEPDIDPREVGSETQPFRLFAFMRELEHMLDKEVILTLDNLQEAVIFRYSPVDDEIRYLPA